MRKADYAALAHILKTESAEAAEWADKDECYRAGYAESCETVAREFAARASVNKDEFLKACGIKP